MKSEYLRTIIQHAKGSIPAVKPRPRFRFEPGNIPNIPDTGNETGDGMDMQFIEPGKNRQGESNIDEQTGNTDYLKKKNSREAFTVNPDDPAEYPGALLHHQPSDQKFAAKVHHKSKLIGKNITEKQNLIKPDTLKNRPGEKSAGKELPGELMNKSDEQGKKTKGTGNEKEEIIPAPAQSDEPRIKKREIHGNESLAGEEVDVKEQHLRYKNTGPDKKSNKKNIGTHGFIKPPLLSSKKQGGGTMETPGILHPSFLSGKKQGEKHLLSKKDPGMQVSGQPGLREREDTLSINISIGTVLIKAVPPVQPQPVKKKSDRIPAMSLEEYLKKVKGR